MDTDSVARVPWRGRSAGIRRETRVNDVHSRLNDTRVREVLSPRTVSELCEIVADAARRGETIAVCGRRHAMGGQQFRTGATLVDTTSLDRVLDLDADHGLVTVEAGLDWRRLVTHLLWAFPDPASAWGIIQKQTGADRLTIGGALSANIHGRGLRLRPFIADVESFDLVGPRGELTTCSRAVNPWLFASAIGGYGLFGVIARVTLRLARRRRVERRVTIGRVDDLPQAVEMRVREGFEYGDFQFAIDPASREFLQVGVFSCYRPVALDVPEPPCQRALTARDWQRLVRLAHVDKSRAFAEYARYYMATDGQIYWSDTHQLAEYHDGYHVELDGGGGAPGSEMISELYVPRAALPAFMAAVRADARQHDVDIIYGTVRIIERDDESALSWARERWACIVFNLHVTHTAEGVAKAANDFRRLIDRAIELGGSYYLTYHRWARADQVLACYPGLPGFLGEKARHDPQGIFGSDWYTHHAELVGVSR